MLRNIIKVDSEALYQLRTKVIWHDFEIVVTEELKSKFLQKSTVFAEELDKKGQSTNYWTEKRNAKNALENNIISKIGELFLCYGLSLKGFPKEVIPDFEVRYGSNKGWYIDLPYAEVNSLYPNIHVKTCDENLSNIAYDTGSRYSWTFQLANSSGPGGRDPLLDNPDSDELIFFMYVPNKYSTRARLIASAPWNKIYHLLKDPILPHLKHLKKCIYSEDIRLIANQ